MLDERMEWLMPNRIIKAFSGTVPPSGGRRLFIIGIGANGVDIALRCKDLTENFFEFNSHSIHFLGIDLSKNLKVADCNGSMLLKNERIGIDPDSAIYPYLNDPKRLPEAARGWFDEGLFNYTENKTPVYGTSKRQCARLCVFHYIDEFVNIFTRIRDDFSGSKNPLEIVFTGNLGDVFLGGMAIDLAYLARSVFESVNYSVRISGHLLAADSSKAQGLSGRDLAGICANTVVAKSELDGFQCKHRRFSQVYSSKVAVQCASAPFAVCNIYESEETYDLTADKVAVRIMSNYLTSEPLYDDVEKRSSTNMSDSDASRKFCYITGESLMNVMPVPKIYCYLSLKLLVEFGKFLSNSTMDEMDLGMLRGKVCPDAMLLASKAGDVPKFEFDERLNPLFSLNSLKRGSSASIGYVMERLETIQNLCKAASDTYSRELFDYVSGICDSAVCDIKKGPRYAEGIVRSCMNALRERADAIRKASVDIDQYVSIEESNLNACFKRLKAPGFMAKKAVDPYIEQLKRFTELKKSQLTGQIMIDFYNTLYSSFDRLLNEKLLKLTNIFNIASELVQSDDIFDSSAYNRFVREVSCSSETTLRDDLDRVVSTLGDDRKYVVFKRANLDVLYRGEPFEVAREVARMTEMCFGDVLSRELTIFSDSSKLAKSLSETIRELSITTPVDNKQSIVKVTIPEGMGDVALRGDDGAKVLTNGSATRNVAFATRIAGGVRLDKFKDYEQWENMRYAYVNDSLKRQGIHIFK